MVDFWRVLVVCVLLTLTVNILVMLVSFAEKAIDDGKLDTILVPRVSEVPSRSLRSTAVDYGISSQIADLSDLFFVDIL